MGTHPRLWGPSLVLLACVILAGASWVAAQAPDTRQLRTPLVAPEDIVAHQVTATDLTVLLGQRVQTILGVHRPDPESGILEGDRKSVV